MLTVEAGTSQTRVRKSKLLDKVGTIHVQYRLGFNYAHNNIWPILPYLSQVLFEYLCVRENRLQVYYPQERAFVGGSCKGEMG